MISVVIPTHTGTYLKDTVDSLLDNSVGEIEIIPVYDGKEPDTLPRVDPRVKPIELSVNRGMRGAFNAGLAAAKGDLIMKSDAHCVFGEGFDKILAENIDEDWLVIPRRYSLYADGWKRDMRFPPKDYHYLSYPVESKGFGKAMFPFEWKELRTARKEFDIDDNMSFQGSCYIANRKYFMQRVGFLDDRTETYTPFGGEQIEVGLKYWLGGGMVKVNKKTWYAHLFKNAKHYKGAGAKDSRKFKVGTEAAGGREWATKHWMLNEEPDMLHPFSWLVEKFWPVPTWPEDRSLWLPT